MNNKIILIIISLLVVSFVSAECIDTDQGKDYYVRGNVTDSFGESSDFCINGPNNVLVEYFCKGNERTGEQYICPNICKDGACVQTPNDGCIDSDGGEDYYTKGAISGSMPDGFISEDMCVSPQGRLREVVCNNGYGSAKLYDCPYGCENGVCKTEQSLNSCIDSDGGKDFYVKGNISGAMPNGYPSEDKCTVPEGRLREVICENDYGTAYLYDCPYGCDNGACLKEEKKCTDSDGGSNYDVRGTVIDSNNERTDYCIDANQAGVMVEYTCENNQIKGN